MDLLSMSTVNWSRAQFALTAGYHWIFVPLTIGLALIMALMETMYVRTGDEKWKIVTKFWQKLFGINFAIGVATGFSSVPTGRTTVGSWVIFLERHSPLKGLWHFFWKPPSFPSCFLDGAG